MIVARFNCPACETPIEAPADSIARGIRCPKCETGFVPSEFKMEDEPVDPGFLNGDRMKPVAPQKTADNAERERAREKRRRDEQDRLREAHNEKWKEFNGLKESAGTLSGIATACVLIGILTGFIGFTGESALFIVAGGAFSTAFTLFIVAQILHIRAALEKLHLKD